MLLYLVVQATVIMVRYVGTFGHHFEKYNTIIVATEIRNLDGHKNSLFH